MRLTGVRRVTSRESRGFTLLEVVIASAMVLMTVVAATATVTSLARGASRQALAASADRVLRDEAARLLALPYCASAYPSAASGADPSALPPADLVAAVFPHAVAIANLPEAQYVTAGTADGPPAGSFVTRVVRGDVTVERVARFVSPPGAAPLASSQVTGWSVWGSTPPPAEAIEVHLTATAHHATRACVLVCSALSPRLQAYDEATEWGGG